MKPYEKALKKTIFIMILLFAAAFILPQNAKAASSKTFTPVSPYFGKSVKLGKYYYASGGNCWFWQSKKKKPADDEEMTYRFLSCDEFTANGTVAYGYHSAYGTGNTIKYHKLFKYNLKSGKRSLLKKVTDKVNPDNSSEDGFRFGTAYGKEVYYNVTQSLKKSGGMYKYTYKLMSINASTKKTKTVRKNFEILVSTKNYIFGKNNKNVFYGFNLKKGKFFKIAGVPKAKSYLTHNARNVGYLAAYKTTYQDGYKKIIIYKIDGAKQKLVKIKTMNAPSGGYVDGYFKEGYFYRTFNTSTFAKMNLKTKKMTKITAREYDYDLDPDYGDEEE